MKNIQIHDEVKCSPGNQNIKLINENKVRVLNDFSSTFLLLYFLLGNGGTFRDMQFWHVSKFIKSSETMLTT